MLTIFSTPKPFEGHTGIIQRNALKSWTLLHPEVEIILFGDEGGTAEICRELGLRHVPEIERTQDGPPSVRSMFTIAQEISRRPVLCYSNCDIILGQDFLRATGRALQETKRFLMIGRRWDTDVTAPIDFANPDWYSELRAFTLAQGFQRLYYNIDYFTFSRGLYVDIPELAIGRRWWDQWAVWKAAAEKAPVIDASDVVIAVHQNHDYSSHPQGWRGVWYGDGARRNFEAAGGWSHLHTIEDAGYRMTEQGLRKNGLYWLAPGKRRIRRAKQFVQTNVRTRMWHPLLGLTRPLRHFVGLKQRNVAEHVRSNEAVRRHPMDRWG